MQQVWNYLINHGMTQEGAAGMMGNMWAESGIIPNRVETLCLQRLAELGKHYTNATYTAFVDDGTITKAQFLNPLPGKQYGYGLCQWTSPTRKSGLYNLAKSRGTSIGDLEMQLEFLVGELQSSYKSVWETLSTTHNVRTATDTVLTKFEMPADTSQAMKNWRYTYSMKYYEQYGGEHMTEAQAIDKVLSIAQAEVGYKEKASASGLDNKDANPGAGNYTKYGRDMHNLQPTNMDYPAAWCDCFVDWCMYKAFGAEAARKVLCGDFDDYTVNSANYYKRAGRWTNTPKRGYQIFFKNSSGICHTGLVKNVVDGRVVTIEGNKNNAVREVSYPVNDSTIAGYGMPLYSILEGVDESGKYTGECTVKTYQLIKGDHGRAVEALQALLNLRGFKGKDGNKLTVDGQFGVNTEHAVTQCQKQAGMTGINFGTVSSLTWAALLN